MNQCEHINYVRMQKQSGCAVKGTCALLSCMGGVQPSPSAGQRTTLPVLAWCAPGRGNAVPQTDALTTLYLDAIHARLSFGSLTVLFYSLSAGECIPFLLQQFWGELLHNGVST